MSSWFKRGSKKGKVVILGPPSTGKTTLMYRLSNQPVPVEMVPTAVDCLEKSMETKYGHKLLFSERKQTDPDADIIIYMLSADELDKQITAVKAFVENINNEAMDQPLLILVNKTDLKTSEYIEHAVADLLMPLLNNKRCFNVIGCSVNKDKNLNFIIDWLEPKIEF